MWWLPWAKRSALTASFGRYGFALLKKIAISSAFDVIVSDYSADGTDDGAFGPADLADATLADPWSGTARPRGARRATCLIMAAIVYSGRLSSAESR